MRLVSTGWLVFVLGCGDTPASPVDADLSFTTDGGALCSAGDPESTCCDILSPVPAQVRTVVDLSDIDAITDGTCGTYAPGRRAVLLPGDPAAYPLAVILPAIDGADPACAATCEFEPYTAFGIAVATDGLIGGNTGRGLAVLVPPPWRFVSGGCGEACAWPCLGGYQEFGVRSCLTFGHGDFGFATADPVAPSVTALVELRDGPETAPLLCCPYR